MKLPWTARPDATHRTGTALRLSELLRDDEASLVTVLDAMDPEERRTLLTPALAGDLMAQALVGDQPVALSALRAANPARTPWNLSPYRDRALARYAQRNRPPKLCVSLFRQGILERDVCVQALRQTTTASFMTLARAGALEQLADDAVQNRATPLDVGSLQELFARGALCARTYCALRAPQRQATQINALLADHASGLVATADVLSYVNPSVEQAVRWVADGRLSAAALVGSGNNLSHDVVRQLYERGLLERTLYFESGAATLDEVAAWLGADEVDAPQAVDLYRLPTDVVNTLYALGNIDTGQYMAASARAWQRGEALPAQHLARVSAPCDINAVLHALPKPSEKALRRSFLVQLYAAHVEATMCLPERLGVVQRFAGAIAAPVAMGVQASQGLVYGTAAWLRRLIWTPPAEVIEPVGAPTPAHAECLACGEALDDEAPGIIFEHCAHPPQFHADCMRQNFDANTQRGLAPSCPSLDCRLPVSLSDGRNLRLESEQTDRLALAIIRANRPPLFKACPTADCCGGTVVPHMQRLEFECVHCEKTTLFDTARALRETLIETIAGMGPRGDTRSCYHCGLGTYRIDGCDAMTCGRDSESHRAITHGACGRNWNFNSGAPGQQPAFYDRQCFVPRAGDLVTAGLFAPLAPGYVHRAGMALPKGVQSIQALVIANATQRGWLRRDTNGELTLA